MFRHSEHHSRAVRQRLWSQPGVIDTLKCYRCRITSENVDIAVGIDVGFSEARRSTGVVILDRATRALAEGSMPVVRDADGALRFVFSEMHRLAPRSATFCVDGSFAAASNSAKARLIEQFFMRGPFASNARLRLSTWPTAPSSRFLATTQKIVAALGAAGHHPMTVSSSGVSGNVVEIFPTIFMASLLPPHAYVGSRNRHTDALWSALIGKRPVLGTVRTCLALSPYQSLIDAIEARPQCELHDVRAAAISAIAADWFATAPPGSSRQSATTFIGHPKEMGFLLPPLSVFDPDFLILMKAHWASVGGPPLFWI